MSAIGFDINPGYREIFINRLGFLTRSAKEWDYRVQDARYLQEIVKPGSVEICVTSPPYWDILKRKRSADGRSSRSYSDEAHDIGNIREYNEFLTAIGDVASQVQFALRYRGYFILNVMDLRKGSTFYPLHKDAISTVLQMTNMVLEDIIVWDRQSDYNSIRPIGYPSKFIINKVHEYLLVFRNSEVTNGKKTLSA